MLKIIKNFLFFILPKNKFLRYKKCDFAFLIHPRDAQDIKSNFKFLKYCPDSILSFCSKYVSPFIISSVKGLKNKKNEDILGYIISCPMTGAEMLKNKKWAKKKILRAIKLSEKLGAKIIGLGAFTSPITNGGIDLAEKTKIAISTGNTYTTAIACQDIEKICQKINYNIKEKTLAIIGATGSIGSAMAKILAKKTTNLILIGRTIKNLETLEREIRGSVNNVNIKISTETNTIKLADIIIVATASSSAVFLSHNVKKNAVIYSISQPSNISQCIKDVLIFKGGLIITPNIKHKVKMNLPHGINFACFSEIMLLAMEETYKNFIGKVNVNNINFINELSKKYNFKSKLFR